MTRQLRVEFPGSLWHITHRGNERRVIFFDDNDRVRFLELFGEAVERFRWIVTAYALMPNHYHAVLELTESGTLSSGMRWLNSAYAQWINWRHDRVGHLFQGRFRSILVEKESHGLEVLRYVVLANMIERPEEYVWSSHRAVLGLEQATPWLALERVLEQFGGEVLARERYRRFVEEGIGSARCPWDDLIGGMYLGSNRWLEKIRDRIEVEPRALEHPIAQRKIARPDMPHIVSTVAIAFGVSDDAVRWERGGAARMAAAWIAWREGGLRRGQIAATLRVRSDGRITQLVDECESRLARDADLRARVEECLSTLRRETND